MAELFTQNAESNQRRGEGSDNNRLAGQTSLKYYIHDSVAALKLQLIGELRAADVAGLNGTWHTAKITLGQRQLVLDLCQLNSTDEEGQRWLAQMRDQGAVSIPDNYFESGVAETRILVAVQAASIRLSLLGRVMGMIRGEAATVKCP
jgi:hypothetical protein